MIKFFGIICGCLMMNVAFGQFNMEDYLSQSTDNVELQTARNQQAYVFETEFKSPLLREVEIRVQDSRFSRGLDDYRLRFSPINPWERKANREYKYAKSRQMDSELNMQLNEVLVDRYLNLIGHFTLSTKKGFLEEQITFYEEILTLSGQQPDQFSVKDVIEIDKKLLEAQLDLQSLEFSLSKIEFHINGSYQFNGGIQWNSISITDVNQIRDWYQSNSNRSIENSPALVRKIQENLVEESIYKVNQKESFSNIGFVQAEYETDYGNRFDENLGIQFGLNIPIVNPDRPDLERRKLDLIETQNKIVEEKTVLEQALSIQLMTVDHLLERYDMIVEKMDNFRSIPISTQLNSNNLDVLIEFREYEWELKNWELGIYRDLLEEYIETLALEGKLIEAPYVNYLSYSKNTYLVDL